MTRQTLLITDIAGYWGEKLAQHIPRDEWRVVGIDTRAPDLPDTADTFIKGNLSDADLTGILRREQVTAVCHLPRRPDVPATAKLLAACAATGVEQVVINSSTQVYGASATAPAHLPETYPLPRTAADPTTKLLRDIELLAASYRGALKVAILRMAHIVGATASGPLIALLSQRAPVMLMGFDPLTQVLHEGDAVGALAHAIATAADDTINIAANPPLPFSRIVALAGKIHLPVPHPVAYLRWRVETTNHLRRRTLPLHPDFLRFRLVADVSKMEDDFGFFPARTATEAVQSFAEHDYFRHLSPDQAARVKRVKQMQNAIAGDTE